MATSFAATASAASVANNGSKPTSYLPLCYRHSHSHSKLSFCMSPKPRLRIFSKSLKSTWNRSPVVRARLDEVAVDASSDNAAAASSSESDVLLSKTEAAKPSNEYSSTDMASEESISEFISQVASLVKLVDSRDIVELKMKQLDCEVVIRKKEALPQPQSPVPIVMMQSPPPQAPAFQLSPPAAVPAPAPVSSPAGPAPTPPALKSAKSSLPSLKSPMAGTFYKCPAPGEPPFVKVGEKVKKGQVLCIIEAMKLMNEIEADQSGTIVEILAEDGKPVSVDSPLFVIEP